MPLKSRKEIELLAAQFNMDPDQMELLDRLINADSLSPQESTQKIIDTRPAQKKITDFFSK
jgi:hypothetical protein